MKYCLVVSVLKLFIGKSGYIRQALTRSLQRRFSKKNLLSPPRFEPMTLPLQRHYLPYRDLHFSNHHFAPINGQYKEHLGAVTEPTNMQQHP